ncbi:hypothetical protein [Rubellicoccus peritrichatus]|uniref:Type IV pilus assembly protein PilM n=1 Tax=Rubellicoccus peritrichatus TaxID=3080537 RepID=A0AAQ3LCK8_9BACT|nr:hypothetical protein [Puniceicoccus sp. CR14]WOO41410.1 hypothetical protein RZN69_22550 [Puniceicoccus sp. CR14]
MARVSRMTAPYHVEAIDEIGLENPEEVQDHILNFVGGTKGQMTPAICGVYPLRRVVRRATLENAAKAKEPSFLPEYLKSQFKVDLDVFSMAALNASDGLAFTPDRGATKELVFCGAPKDELNEEQDRLVSYGLFPQRIEIGTIGTLGGLMHHCDVEKMHSPTLVLEISSESAQVLIFHDGELQVARPIPYGLNSMYPVVQKELGLKDEESAKKLFSSNTFDFTEMGQTLLRKLMKELQASTGFYEVQTGQTIGQIYLGLLPENLSWVGSTLSRNLGVEELIVDLNDWISTQNITISDQVELAGRGARWFSLFSLIGNYNPIKDGKAANGEG